MTAVRRLRYLLSPDPRPTGLLFHFPLPPLLPSPLQQPGCGHASRKSRRERSPPPVRGIDKQRAAGSPNALIHQSWQTKNTSRLALHGRNVFGMPGPGSGYSSKLADPSQQKCHSVSSGTPGQLNRPQAGTRATIVTIPRKTSRFEVERW